MTPASERSDVASFYHLRGASLADRTCAGTACFVARARDPERWRHAVEREPRVYCLGKCYVAPSATEDRARPAIRAVAARPIVLERLVDGSVRSLADYAGRGGYRALDGALGMAPGAVVEEVERSQLRGRGGAGFPTGRKLRAVASVAGAAKYVVLNADEGDPGAYVDRILLEDDPHALLEGLALAGYAVGATRGYVYLRGEYPDALPILETAITEARNAGILGDRMLGRGPAFDVEVVVGLGSYVCGEETALLDSIEGRRPFVRSRPPYPSTRGLYGHPTLVQNVETLANFPWIVRHGGDAYAAAGFSRSRGTKLVSLNSLFRRPGLYEVDFGTPVRRIVEQLGGGLATGAIRGAIRGVIIGGPLAGVLPPRHFDVPLAFEELAALGASVGHGGVVAFDEHTSLRELAHHVFSFGADESCGRCTPCRLGARSIEHMSDDDPAKAPWDAARFRDIVSALHATSLCGHGTGLGEFARSLLRHYPGELESCFASS